jgi:hypothetical protein
MWPWSATTRGYVYLFHFARPLGNLQNPRAQAHHYVGFAVDLAERLTAQLTGRGAKIVAAAVERKIAFDIYFWPATLAVEKQIKRRKETHVFCPTCCRLAGRRLRPIPIAVEQLALPLDDDELPQVAPGPADWYEVQTLQRWRAARVPYSATLPDDWDDGLL